MKNLFRCLCAKNYQHRTWSDRVIEKIKRVFFCLTGYIVTYDKSNIYSTDHNNYQLVIMGHVFKLAQAYCHLCPALHIVVGKFFNGQLSLPTTRAPAGLLAVADDMHSNGSIIIV